MEYFSLLGFGLKCNGVIQKTDTYSGCTLFCSFISHDYGCGMLFAIQLPRKREIFSLPAKMSGRALKEHI